MIAKKLKRRIRVKQRIRKKIKGTSERPRIAVFRSNKEIYAQVIDDIAGHTLAAASSREIKNKNGTKTDQSKEVGKVLAQRIKGAGIDKVVFDRGGYLYHGRVKALAEGAREGGLEF